MRNLLAIFAFAIILVPSYGQQEDFITGKIKLKNGTRLRGSIEDLGADAVIVRTANGQGLRIPNDKIRKITLDKNPSLSAESALFDIHLEDGSFIQSVAPSKDQPKLNFRTQSGDPLTLNYDQIWSFERSRSGLGTTHQKAGGKFFHWMEFGGLFGRNTREETTAAFSVHTINGYRLWNFLEPGLGVGFDLYEDFTVLPVYASIRADLVKAPIIPYYFASAGYGFAWQNSKTRIDFDQVRGGFGWTAGMGVKIPLERISVLVGAGYKHQSITTLTGSVELHGFETEQLRKIRRFSLMTGITF